MIKNTSILDLIFFHFGLFTLGLFLHRVCESLTREEVFMSLLVYYKHRKLSCDIEPDKIVTTVVLSAAYRLKQITIRKVTMHIKLKAKASYSQF